MEIFAKRLRQLRDEKELRQKDLAEKLGYARTTIANYEQASRLPPLDTLFKIADYFQVSMDYLLGRTDVKLTAAQVIYERLKVPILIIDPETGGIFDCNELAVNFYGYNKSQLLKMKIYSINILDNNTITSKINEIIKQQQNTYKFKHKLVDGSIKDVRVFTEPITINSKTYIFSAIHDISDSKNEKTDFSGIKKHINALNKIFNYKTPSKRNHHINVSKISLAISDKLNLENNTTKYLEIAAGIHDIGLLMIPIEIASKLDSLNKNELRFYKKHPIYGADLTKDIDTKLSKIILQHHEHIDGSGYPYGLRDNEIELEARIITVANTIDNMIYEGNCRTAQDKNKIISHLHRHKGKRYDKIITEAVLELIKDNLI